MIDIGKKYCIGSDPNNVTLYERRTNKDGKGILKAIGYYSNPRNALMGLVNLKVKKTEFKDMVTICDKLDEIKKVVDKLLLEEGK